MLAPGTYDPSLVGRQIFFVRPSALIQQEVLPELLAAEYAATVVDDHRQVRALARLYPHGIVYINLDEGFAEPEWEEVIRDLRGAPETADVRIGILSAQADSEKLHKYMLELEVPCGFIKVGLQPAEVTASLLKVLEANQARGRRQYLRVPCLPGWASLNIMVGNRVLGGELADISSVGLSCTFEKDPEFVARTMVKNIQLKLKGLLCQVNAIVMGTRPRDGRPPLYVFLFDPQTPVSVKEKIRTYQRKALQQMLETELNQTAKPIP